MKIISRTLFLLLLTVSGYSATKAPQAWSEQLYAKYCAGKFDEFNLQVKQTSKSDPNYETARVFSLMTSEGQDAALAEVIKRPFDLRQIDEIDRVVYASVLLLAGGKEKDQIKNLINFKSQRGAVEKYRVLIDSQIDEIEGRPEEALHKLLEMQDRLPPDDITLLPNIFSLGGRDKNAKLILQPFFSKVDALSDEDSIKYYLMAYKEAASTGDTYSKQALAYDKKAYEMCNHETAFALNYAAGLIYSNQLPQAEEILLANIKNKKFYSPYVDLFLAKMFASKGDKNQTEHFLNRAKAARELIPPKARDFNISVTSENPWPIRLGIGLLLVLAISIIFMFNRKSKLQS